MYSSILSFLGNSKSQSIRQRGDGEHRSRRSARDEDKKGRKEGRRRTLTGRGEKKGVNAERGATRPKDAKLPKKSTR